MRLCDCDLKGLSVDQSWTLKCFGHPAAIHSSRSSRRHRVVPFPILTGVMILPALNHRQTVRSDTSSKRATAFEETSWTFVVFAAIWSFMGYGALCRLRGHLMFTRSYSWGRTLLGGDLNKWKKPTLKRPRRPCAYKVTRGYTAFYVRHCG